MRRPGRPGKGKFPPTRKMLLDQAKSEALLMSFGRGWSAKMRGHCGSLPSTCDADLTPPDLTADYRWFCVQTHQGQESKAADELRKQDFIVFLPVVLRELHRRTAPRPALPRYLFVAFDPARAPWRHISYTFGVVRLFAFTTFEPAPARRGDVERLIEHFVTLNGRPDPVAAALPEIQPGAHGWVEDGPFTGFACTVVGGEEDGRIVVNVSIFGRESPVTLERDAIRLGGDGAANLTRRAAGPGLHP